VSPIVRQLSHTSNLPERSLARVNAGRSGVAGTRGVESVVRG